MSYCVHCGVELDEKAGRCPLCGTRVLDPAALPEEDGPAFFPTRPAKVEPVSKFSMALLISSMLISVTVCCGLLNLVLKPGTPWSLYVLGAAVMLWVWAVFPLLARKSPVWLRFGLDLVMVALYVGLIAKTVEGERWYLLLAVPMMLFIGATLALTLWIFRVKRSMLSTVTVFLAAIGLICVEIELCCDLYFHRAVNLGWSLVVFACCFGVCVPLIVIRRVPSLREEVRRRFHM